MFENLTVFSVAHAMAKHAGQAQAVAAQNVANADTPDYQRKVMPSFEAHIPRDGGMRTTREGHATGFSAPFSSTQTQAQGAAPNGNTVTLEEEILASVDAKRQHDRALAIYKSSLTVLRASLGRR